MRHPDVVPRMVVSARVPAGRLATHTQRAYQKSDFMLQSMHLIHSSALRTEATSQYLSCHHIFT